MGCCGGIHFEDSRVITQLNWCSEQGYIVWGLSPVLIKIALI